MTSLHSSIMISWGTMAYGWSHKHLSVYRINNRFHSIRCHSVVFISFVTFGMPNFFPIAHRPNKKKRHEKINVWRKLANYWTSTFIDEKQMCMCAAFAFACVFISLMNKLVISIHQLYINDQMAQFRSNYSFNFTIVSMWYDT